MSLLKTIDCHLRGSEIDELIEIIESIADVSDLKDFLIPLDLRLDRLVGEGLSGHDVTRELIFKLDQIGMTSDFLSIVKKKRPRDICLAQFVDKIAPQSKHGSEATRTISEGLQTLTGLPNDNASAVDAITLVTPSLKKLRALELGLKRLGAYKTLHDTLHRVQLGSYNQILADINRIHEDQIYRLQIRQQLALLKMNCREGFRAAQLLEALDASEPLERGVSELESEGGWVITLTNAVEQLGYAIEEGDDEVAREAILSIRAVIWSEPPRVNGLLRLVAQTLPIDNLLETVEKVSGIPNLQVKQREALDRTKLKLITLQGDLRGKVTIHNRWQAVETLLLAAEFEIERDADDAPKAFRAYWSNVKSTIKPLWALDPLAEWVSATQRCGKEIDVALGAAPMEMRAARLSYTRFRFDAALQFFEVDADLRAFCDEVSTLSDPLTQVIEGYDR